MLEDRILKDKFLNSSVLNKADSIGIFISMPLEVNTAPIISALWKINKRVYIPRCLPKKEWNLLFMIKIQI